MKHACLCSSIYNRGYVQSKVNWSKVDTQEQYQQILLIVHAIPVSWPYSLLCNGVCCYIWPQISFVSYSHEPMKWTIFDGFNLIHVSCWGSSSTTLSFMHSLNYMFFCVEVLGNQLSHHCSQAYFHVEFICYDRFVLLSVRGEWQWCSV